MWWEKEQVLCACVRAFYACIGVQWKAVHRRTTRLLSELHLMWWMRLSIPKMYVWTYKCLRSECVVWEWPFICNNSSLAGYIFPLSPPFHHHAQTIAWFQSCCYNTPPKKTTWTVKLISSDGTTLTGPILLKTQGAVSSVTSAKPVESSRNCAPLSIHPRDTLHRVLRRGPRGTEWAKT